jgi:hypothetical protein
VELEGLQAVPGVENVVVLGPEVPDYDLGQVLRILD